MDMMNDLQQMSASPVLCGVIWVVLTLECARSPPCVNAGQVQWAELHHGEASHLPCTLPVLALQLHHPLPPEAVCALH